MSLRHDLIVRRLAEGECVTCCESGNSMSPVIKHREPVVLAPVDPTKLTAGDIVLARVRGKFYLHRISAISGNRVQIANLSGHVNGWTTRKRVFGIVLSVNGRPIRNARRKALLNRT